MVRVSKPGRDSRSWPPHLPQWARCPENPEPLDLRDLRQAGAPLGSVPPSSLASEPYSKLSTPGGGERLTGESFYTIPEVAAYFRVSSRTVRRWVKANILRRIEVTGRLVRIPGEEVIRLAKS